MKRWIAFEQLSAASALAGTQFVGLLGGCEHSHDVHRGLLVWSSGGPPTAGSAPDLTSIVSRGAVESSNVILVLIY